MSNYGGMPEKKPGETKRVVYVERTPQRSVFWSVLGALIAFSILSGLIWLIAILIHK
jgi:preprotein translocase subunit SecE